MRTIKLRQVITACVAAYATALPVFAQQTAPDAKPNQANQPAQPNQLQKLEDSDIPAITVESDKPRSSSIETRAPGGRVTEIQVTSGNSTYYLKPPNSQYGGSWMPAEGEASYLRVPQWQIMTFDRGRSQSERDADAARAASTPPPPALRAP